MRKLNEQQKIALRGVASGKSMTEAGRLANYSKNCASQVVRKLMKRPDAQAFLGDLQNKANSATILDVTARKEHLSKIVTNQVSTPTEQIAAIHALNKMDGVYIERVETNVNHGGVMLVPIAATVDEWQSVAESTQAKLMTNTIEVN